MGPSPQSVLLHAKRWLLDQNYKSPCVSDFTCRCEWKTAWLSSDLLVPMGPSPHRCCLHLNKDFWSRIISLYLSLTSPVVLCLQNSVISIRITSLCGSHTLPVVFAFKTAWLASELLVSMGPIPHLSICACKTAWLGSDSLVSVGPSPHLWFLKGKQSLLDQNYKSLWVPDLTCRFVLAKQRDYHQNY